MPEPDASQFLKTARTGRKSTIQLSAKAFEDKITHAGWKNLPNWYQVSSEDRMIPPQAEQFMAERIKANTITLEASHCSMVSMPHDIAEFILSAAEEVATAAEEKMEMEIER